MGLKSVHYNSLPIAYDRLPLFFIHFIITLLINSIDIK